MRSRSRSETPSISVPSLTRRRAVRSGRDRPSGEVPGTDVSLDSVSEGRKRPSREPDGAVVGYLDDGTLMVREQKGKRLGKVFSPRLRDKYTSVTEKAPDGTMVTKMIYDGRPVSEVEAYLFDMLNWIPKE